MIHRQCDVGGNSFDPPPFAIYGELCVWRWENDTTWVLRYDVWRYRGRMWLLLKPLTLCTPAAAVSHVRMLTDADVAAMEERDPYATAQCKEEITTTEESVSDGDTKSDCGAAVVMGQRSSVSSSDSADSPRPVRSSWSATSVPLEDEDED